MLTKRSKGTAAINEILDPGVLVPGAFILEDIRVHLSAAGGAGNLTVTLDSVDGSEYDTILLTQDMTLVTDLLWQPDGPVSCDKGDKIVIAWANANGRTYGLEVKYSEGR